MVLVIYSRRILLAIYVLTCNYVRNGKLDIAFFVKTTVSTTLAFDKNLYMLHIQHYLFLLNGSP